MEHYTFGNALKAYREEHDLSQQELADILGTSKQVLSRYETGQRDPKISLAKEYAEKLNLPLPYFLGSSTSLDQENDIFNLSDFERDIITRLRRLPEEQQQAFLLILSGTKTPEP